MSDRMRCPRCGSRDVYCNGEPGPKHDHICHACGLTLVPPAGRPPEVSDQ